MGKKPENYLEKFQEERKHWDEVYKNGCSDPFWTDGANLNLIRNHCIHYAELAADQSSDSLFAGSSTFDIPPEVSNEYIAREQEKLAYYERFLSQMRDSGFFDKWTRFRKMYEKYHQKKEFVPHAYRLLNCTLSPSKAKLNIIRTFGREDAFEWWKGVYAECRNQIDELSARFEKRQKEELAARLEENPKTEMEPWGEQILLFS